MGEQKTFEVIDPRHKRVLLVLLEEVQRQQADLIQTAADLVGLVNKDGLNLEIRDGSMFLVRREPQEQK